MNQKAHAGTPFSPDKEAGFGSTNDGLDQQPPPSSFGSLFYGGDVGIGIVLWGTITVVEIVRLWRLFTQT